MKPIIAYISDPITGANAYEVEQNIRAAEACMVELLRAGITPICVHTMGRHLDGLLAHAEWMEHDLRILDRCDAVVLCTGAYAASRGTQQEIKYATKHGIPVYASAEALIARRRAV